MIFYRNMVRNFYFWQLQLKQLIWSTGAARIWRESAKPLGSSNEVSCWRIEDRGPNCSHESGITAHLTPPLYFKSVLQILDFWQTKQEKSTVKASTSFFGREGFPFLLTFRVFQRFLYTFPLLAPFVKFFNNCFGRGKFCRFWSELYQLKVW